MRNERSPLRFLTTLLVGLFAGLAASACSSGSDGAAGTATGELRIVATDAPIDPSIIASAMLEVGKVRIHRETVNEDEDEWVTLYDGAPFEVGISSLRNGITQGIASGILEVGTYRQIRLHLTGARLELTNGNVYDTDDGTLETPSSMTAGFKVFLEPGVDIPEDGVEYVVLDFDLTKTFSPIPGNDPLTATRYKLHPNIRAGVESVSGRLSAIVRRDDGTGMLVGVPNAMVHVLEPGELDPANAFATTITDDNGAAMVLVLPEGTFDVMAEEGGTEVRQNGVSIVRGEETLVELELP